MVYLILAICIGFMPAFVARGMSCMYRRRWLYGATPFPVAIDHVLEIEQQGAN